MDDSQPPYPVEPQEDDPRYFVPNWLQQVREQDLEAIADMTPEETAAYYEQRAAQVQVGQATRVEK
jgi:hypothetical protein